ncbi:MAG: addiction module antitoxin [Alphaproteobacteria bacterium]|nr:addiction module antitoxin [Alphaproteobacteria bacterium]
MTAQDTPIIKRLNATLPLPLAQFVGEMTGEGGLYETPSEFVRDLIRRYMEKTAAAESHAINDLLRQSIAENSYSPLTAKDAKSIRDVLA